MPTSSCPVVLTAANLAYDALLANGAAAVANGFPLCSDGYPLASSLLPLCAALAVLEGRGRLAVSVAADFLSEAEGMV